MQPPKRWTMCLLAAIVLAAVLGGVAYWRAPQVGQFTDRAAPTDFDAAFAELRSGNSRFVNSARTLSTDTAHDAEYRHETAKKQHPFAVILGCSDSRICPEFIFDQRAGSIFEIRNAGNVVEEDVLASFCMPWNISMFHSCSSWDIKAVGRSMPSARRERSRFMTTCENCRDI